MSTPHHDTSTNNAPPTSPRPPHEIFGTALGQVSRLWRAELDRRLAPFDLTQARWLTLLLLSRLAEPPNQREVAELIGVQGPTLVRTLDWLEGRGLIERRPVPDDRRAKSLHLTLAAKPTLEGIESVVEELRAELLGDVSPADLSVCLRVLRDVALRLGRGPEPAWCGECGERGTQHA